MTALHTIDGTISLNDLPVSALTPDGLGDTLAKINRFAGRTPLPWPVSAHSVVVSRLCPDPQDKAWALLHDAHEAFIGDIITPAVDFIARQTEYRHTINQSVRCAKHHLDRQIAAAWGMEPRWTSKDVAFFDWIALQAEKAVFFDVDHERDPQGHIERAVNLIIELQDAGDWRFFRRLWVEEAVHLASAGLLTLPKIET